MKYEYITMDFETASSSYTSACSLGLCCVNDGKIVDKKYYLINPNCEFNLYNVSIHHITKEDVLDAPSFDIIYSEIYDLINDNIIVCHDSRFDINVLYSLIKKYNLKYPNIYIACSLMASNIYYKGIVNNFKLQTLSSYLGVVHDAHNAISDASICFYLIEDMKKRLNLQNIDLLYEYLGLGFGKLNDKIKSGCYLINKHKKCFNIISNRLEDKKIGFLGKPKWNSLNLYKQKVYENNGIVCKGLTLECNLIVMFLNPSSKDLLSLNRIKKYRVIEVINEKEFLGILNGK